MQTQDMNMRHELQIIMDHLGLQADVPREVQSTHIDDAAMVRIIDGLGWEENDIEFEKE